MNALYAKIKMNDKNLAFYTSRKGNNERDITRLNETAGKISEMVEALQPELKAARDSAVEMDAKLYKGWSRFFLVKHIHSNQHCSSFRYTTRVGWLPNVSGLTEAEAVAEHGEALCTICFPSAPVELTTKPADQSRCPGTIDKDAPSRRGYYNSNWATCAECGGRFALVDNGYKLRKHKK